MDDDKKNKAWKQLPPQKIEKKGKPNSAELGQDQKSSYNKFRHNCLTLKWSHLDCKA